MMILVGMMSIAGVLAFSGGIGGFDILGSTDEEAVDQATPPTDVGEDKGLSLIHISEPTRPY